MSSTKPLRINHATPGVDGYFPLNEPKVGTPDFPKVCQDKLRWETHANYVVTGPHQK